MILEGVAKSQGVRYLSPLGSGGLVASVSAKAVEWFMQNPKDSLFAQR